MNQPAQWWGEPLLAGLEALSSPVMLCNDDLSLRWANTAAQGQELAAILCDLLEQAVFLRPNSTFFDEIRQNNPCVLQGEGLLDVRFRFLFQPVCENGELLGCIVTPAAPSVPSAPHLEGFERVLSTFAHQTRNPLSTVFLALSGLARCNLEYEDPDLREYIGTISTQCYRLLRTSANFTEIQRYEHHLALFRPERQDLRFFVEQLCHLVSVMIKPLGVRFDCQLPEEPLPALFDPEKVSSILLNLISNAVKFIGENGQITVTLTADAQNAAITVEDNGLGISERVLGAVFEPYFSYDPRTESICGDGLGLSISREAARMHGGAIVLHSTPGQGTRVVFSLPLTQEGPQKMTLRDGATNHLYDRFSSLFVILSDVCKVPEL